MPFAKKLYFACSILVPFVAASALYEMAWGLIGNSQSAYRLALYCMLALICLIKIRVHVGGRLPRSRLFWLHLPCAIIFLILLAALAFWKDSFALGVLASTLFAWVLISGALLLYRGTKRNV